MNPILTALIGILGVIIGGVLTFFLNKNLKKDETKLKLIEKLIDRRFEAIDEVFEISKLMKTTVNAEVISYPDKFGTYVAILDSLKVYVDFKFKFYNLYNKSSHFLPIELKNELFLIQEYIFNLDRIALEIPDKRFYEIGLELKGDFLKFSNKLEKLCLNFLEKSANKLDIKFESEELSLSDKERANILLKTQLFMKFQELKNINK